MDKTDVDRLLDAAGLAFAQFGHPATMVDVAALAGCSRATLYRRFPNREAIRLAFVHRATLRIAARIAPQHIPGNVDTMVDLPQRGIRAVRSDPMLAVWFEPQNVAIPMALSQGSELLQAMTAGLAGEFAEDPGAFADVELRGAWILRSIVSLLAMPARARRSSESGSRSSWSHCCSPTARTEGRP